MISKTTTLHVLHYTGDGQLPNFTFIENLNKWRSNFFFSLNFDTFLRNLTPGEFELASPIACSSRVNYRDSPLWRACSQAKVPKNARTLESFVIFGSGGSRPSDGGGGGGGGVHPDPKLTGGARSQKKNFSALQASVWSKNKAGPGPRGPRGPLPWIRHCLGPLLSYPPSVRHLLTFLYCFAL